MSRKFLIVYNPFSGKKKAEKVLGLVKESLSEENIDFSVFKTIGQDNTQAIAAELSDSYTDVLVLGGDGTLNHTINAVRGHQVTLSLIPCGTGNDFAKNISLGTSLSDQIETAINGKAINVDAGLCNEQLFINGVGMGFDGQIVYDMLNKRSLLKGHAKYYAQVLRILATYQPEELQFDFNQSSHHESTLLLVIGNGTTFGGGFKLTPDATIRDGMLDICVIGNVSPVRRFLNIHRLSNGTHDAIKEVKMDKTDTISITGNSSIKAHIDGEFLGSPPFNIKVLPGFFKFRAKQ